MLAAGSFSSPYEHLSQPETKRMVEHYTAYLSDNTRLIANPGLKVNKHGNTHATHGEDQPVGAHRVNVVYLANRWHIANPAVRLKAHIFIFFHKYVQTHN